MFFFITGTLLVALIVTLAVSAMLRAVGYRVINHRLVHFEAGFYDLIPNKKLPRLYKIVGEYGRAQNGGHGTWSLPKGDIPGDWWQETSVRPCHSGLHLTTADDAQDWHQPGSIVYRVEVDGPAIRSDHKYVASRVRLLYPVVTKSLAYWPGYMLASAIRIAELKRQEAALVEATDKPTYD